MVHSGREIRVEAEAAGLIRSILRNNVSLLLFDSLSLLYTIQVPQPGIPFLLELRGVLNIN